MHIWSGKIYLTVILIGIIFSTSLAWTNAIEVNFARAFAWIKKVSIEYLSVMTKRIQQHKEWMIRSYVVTFAFVSFRWLNELTIVKNLMREFEERGTTVIWL